MSAALLVALQAGQLPSPARGRVRGEDEAMLPDPMPQAKPLRAAAAARRAAAWKTQQLGGVHQPMTSLRQMEAVLPAEEARQATVEEATLPAAAAVWQVEAAPPPTTRRQWFHLARRGTRKWCTAASRLILRLQMVAAARWARVLPAAVWQAKALQPAEALQEAL